MDHHREPVWSLGLSLPGVIRQPWFSRLARLRSALAVGFGGLVIAGMAGCFDPEIPSRLACSSGEKECPSSQECFEGLCYRSDELPLGFDASPDHDGDVDIDASAIDAGDADADAPADAGRPADAAVPVQCSPRTQQPCSLFERCAFVATTTEEPFEGFLGCVSMAGADTSGNADACEYSNSAREGVFDTCQPGLLCRDGAGCRAACDLDAPECPVGTTCQPIDFTQPDLHPFGLCDT
jgi:hypothetical protein